MVEYSCLLSGSYQLGSVLCFSTGYTSADSPDETRLSQLGNSMRDLIRNVHGMSYTSQKSIGLYPTSGTASDW